MVTGRGTADVRASQASVRLEYHLSYTDGRVLLAIEKQQVELKEFSVAVSDTKNGWLYNMILAVLNTRLRQMLEAQLLLAALAQLKSLANMVNQMAKGFLTISLASHLRHAVAEADALAMSAPEAQQVAASLLRAFEPGFCPDEQLLVVDELTIGLLISCSSSPKVLLYDGADQPPEYFRQVAQAFVVAPCLSFLLQVSAAMVAKGLVFGYVPASHSGVLSEFGLQQHSGGEPVLWVCQPDIRFQHVLSCPLAPGPVMAQLEYFSCSPGRVMHACEESLAWSVGHVPAGTAVVVLFVDSNESPSWFDSAAASMHQRQLGGSNSFAFVAMHHPSEKTKSRYKVAECPGIMVLPGPGQRPHAQLVPARDVTEFSTFLQRFIFDTRSIVNLTGDNIEYFLHRDVGTLKCVLFTSHQAVPKLYKELWERYGERVTFGIVVSPQPEVMDKFGIVDAPGPMIPPVLLGFLASSFQVYKGDLDEPSIGEFLIGMANK